MSQDRGRSAYRANSDGLSSYYRERFGSHSPEEYMNLRISGFDDHLERDAIKRDLQNVLRKYEPFEIKVVRNPEEDERLAYVNFDRPECARKVRYHSMDHMRELFGRRVQCDPAGILRDQEGKYIPDRFNRALQGTERRPESNRGHGGRGGGGGGKDSTWKLKENDQEATRTLFVGNMPADVREREIRFLFEHYGKIEDIDIKTPINTDAAYAFVMFQTVGQAIDAKHGEQNRPIRTGGGNMKIGYGKSQISRRLWVGGLGSWCTRSMLNQEFDRYGPIDRLDYDEGDEFAYITFDQTHAAQDACRAMKNFPLGGGNRVITVDFAKDPTNSTDKTVRKRRASKSPSGLGGNGPRTPSDDAVPIRTFEALDDEYACTWTGAMVLKKTEYPVKMYRVFGSEKLLQKLLKDEDCNPIKLPITQRLALVSQEALRQKLLTCTKKDIALMVISAKRNEDDLKPFIKYFKDKDAAGVVTVPKGNLYLFPYCDFALKLTAEFCSHIRLMSDSAPLILGALVLRANSPPPSSPR